MTSQISEDISINFKVKETGQGSLGSEYRQAAGSCEHRND
jgi:hypothetical protein